MRVWLTHPISPLCPNKIGRASCNSTFKQYVYRNFREWLMPSFLWDIHLKVTKPKNWTKINWDNPLWSINSNLSISSLVTYPSTLGQQTNSPTLDLVCCGLINIICLSLGILPVGQRERSLWNLWRIACKPRGKYWFHLKTAYFNTVLE